MPAPAAGAPSFGAPGSYIPPRKRLVLACLGGANILAMLLAFSLPVYTLSSFFGISKTVTLFTSGFCVVFFLVSLVLIVCAVGLMFLGTKVRRGALFIYPVVGTLFGGLLLVLSVHWSAVDADPGLGVAVERGPGFLFLWVTVITYIAMAVFVVGMIWRYRFSQFSWTTRSSQIYESRLLRIGAPLFHFGLLFAFGGHLMGLVIPKSWTDALGIGQETYHLVAVAGGWVSGIMIAVGYLILIIRRIAVPAVRKATTIGDVVMYVVLTAILVTGAWNTLTTTFDHHYNYRQGVSPWFRSIFTFQPNIELMVNSPFSFQAHAFLAFLILLIWPFTRLVHAFSIPVGYVTRPYVVYRSAGRKPARHTNVPAGLWDKPKLKEQV